MTKSGSDTLLSTIVESHNATVRQRQLNLTLALLTCNLTRYRTVYLVGQPILTCHSLKLQYAAYVFVENVVLAVLRSLLVSILGILVVTLYGLVAHDGLR